MSADRVRWEHIQRVYELCDRNVSETARRLNMHRRTLRVYWQSAVQNKYSYSQIEPFEMQVCLYSFSNVKYSQNPKLS